MMLSEETPVLKDFLWVWHPIIPTGLEPATFTLSKQRFESVLYLTMDKKPKEK
jgi:hypothetical protein